MQCPICLSHQFQSISDSFHLCTDCEVVFNSNHSSAIYNDDYFIDDYALQYGKTYEEDFDNIYSLSEKRLNKIFKLIGKSNSLLSLLDIGCALGFFLKRAQDFGIKDLQGIEISDYGAQYCREKFNIPVINVSIDDIDSLKNFDIISAWFVIEHLENPLSVINNLYKHLLPGGVLALSLPSYYGPSFSFNKGQWIKDHPQDHIIDVSPRSIRRLLKKIGFKKVRIYRAGFHPERIVSRDSMFYKPFSWIYGVFTKMTAYSDTVEVYAQR